MSADGTDLQDEFDPRPVRSHDLVMRGRVWDVVRDEVDLGEAGRHVREYVRHPGAVAVMAMDDDDRVCLIQQYRHPIGTRDWELPAGLRDVEGEPPWETAARELAEEADLTASWWRVLADVWTSPGGLSEQIRIYLARRLAPVPEAQRHTRDAEEHGMPRVWVPLEDVVGAALAGRVRNATLVTGVLAATVAREREWATLRSPESPW